MEKRALPTRHNFLTEAVQNILEAKIVSNQPILDNNTLLTVTTTDMKRIKGLTDMGLPPLEEPVQIPLLPGFKPYKQTNAQKKLLEPVVAEEEYLKRHRRLEMEEKKTKNREKERLKHGYYQQKQIVERIKTIEKSTLQSIVSSIRHRNLRKENDNNNNDSDNKANSRNNNNNNSSTYTMIPDDSDDEESYLDSLHQKLLKDAQDLLARYEALGLSKTLLSEDHSDNEDIENQKEHEGGGGGGGGGTTGGVMEGGEGGGHHDLDYRKKKANIESAFDKALQTEVTKQRERQIQSFQTQPMFAGQQPLYLGSRRSTRHVVAFGQKLPAFETTEFTLPADTFCTLIEKRETKQRKS